MSDIHFDPAVYRKMESLKEAIKKVMEFSFTMMIELHTEECKQYDRA